MFCVRLADVVVGLQPIVSNFTLCCNLSFLSSLSSLAYFLAAAARAFLFTVCCRVEFSTE